MKAKYLFKTSLILAMISLSLFGCVTKNPNYVDPLPGQTDTNAFPKYQADMERILSLSNSAARINSATAPINPYAVFSGSAISFGGWLVGAVSLFVAKLKSGQKNDAVAALGTMAEGVVKTGVEATRAVLDHASMSDHFARIATVLNENTGANQTITGQVKTA